MVARGKNYIPCFLTIVLILLSLSTLAQALDRTHRYPVKVNVSDASLFDPNVVSTSAFPRIGSSSWDVAAGQSRHEAFFHFIDRFGKACE